MTRALLGNDVTKRQWLARIAVAVCALAIVAVFIAPADRASAAETWTSVTAPNGGSTTLPDGSTVSVSLTQAAVSGIWAGSPYFAPDLKYATVSNSTPANLTFTFSRPMSDLKVYYGWVNINDPFTLSTNVAPSGLDLTDSSLVTSALPYACSNDCVGTGTLTSSGLIASGMVSGSVYNGVLILHFATPISTFTVANPRTVAGVNGLGITVRSYAVTYDTQGGSAVADTPYLPGDTVTLASAPTRSGYRFTGWFTASSGGTEVTSPLGPLTAQDTPVFAQWVPLTTSPGTHTVSGVPGTAITPTTAFTPAEFDGTPTYSISGTLPDGLDFDSTTGVISGTPISESASQTYTITATYLDQTATASVTISVATVSTISPGTQTISGVQGTAITPTAPFTPTGFAGAPTYSITGDLPDGLSLDPNTGVISGTPQHEMASLTYTITATYLTKTATSTVTISVAAASNNGGQGLPLTGTSIGILSGILAAGIGLILFAFFSFSGKRRLHLLGVDSVLSSKLQELNAAFARMDAAQRRARLRRRRPPTS